MVKVIYNNQLVYKVVSWVFFGISLWKEKVDLMSIYDSSSRVNPSLQQFWPYHTRSEKHFVSKTSS